MVHYSDLRAQDILNILHDYSNIVDMDLTLNELHDIAEFINVLCNNDKLYADFMESASNYERMCGWNEREPLEVTEQDCEDAFNCVKWRVQELAEEACGNPYSFLA